MKKLLVSTIFSLTFLNLQAQELKATEKNIYHPAFNLHPFMGVMRTEVNALQYDSTFEYKIVIDINTKSSKSKKMNSALKEAGRIYNLAMASGAPKDKIKMALVIHGDAIDAIYNDQAYKKEHGTENPNTELITALKSAGVHLYVCGQNLGYKEIPIESLAPEIEIALSAKTAFVVLDQKGFTYLSVH